MDVDREQARAWLRAGPNAVPAERQLVPVEAAAASNGVSADFLRSLARAGLLSHERRGGALFVAPVILAGANSRLRPSSR